MSSEVLTRVLRDLAEPASEPDLLAALESGAPTLIETDLIHRLVPFAATLARMDYSDHPWAGLIAGVAICAIDRAEGRRLLASAREHFEASGDLAAIGHACFLEGLEEMGSGRIDAAERWFARSRDLLGDHNPIDAIANAHQAFAMYQAGDLRAAVATVQRSLHVARMNADHRLLGIASVYMGFFRLWTGDLVGVDRAVADAIAASLAIDNPLDRYELPLAHALDAVVCAIRGNFERAESGYDAALAVARSMENEWYEAIIRTTRAEFTASIDPVRALDDAQRALRYFEWAGETWWRNWAMQSLLVVHRELGDSGASIEAGEQLMRCDLNPLEAARARLEVGHAMLDAGLIRESTVLLMQARDALNDAGVELWAAEAEQLLARGDRARSLHWAKAARRRLRLHPSDEGWRRVARGPHRIEVSILGRDEIVLDGKPLYFQTRAERLALIGLVLAGDSGLSNDVLIDRVWPLVDPDRGAHRLDNLVSSLRRTLLPSTPLWRERGRVFVDVDPNACDALRCARRAGNILEHGSETDAVEIAALERQLRSRMLGGAYDEWLLDVEDELAALADRLVTFVRR